MLIDTSVWIDHFRHRSGRLSGYLESGEVWTHPFIIGELACGALTRAFARASSFGFAPKWEVTTTPCSRTSRTLGVHLGTSLMLLESWASNV